MRVAQVVCPVRSCWIVGSLNGVVTEAHGSNFSNLLSVLFFSEGVPLAVPGTLPPPQMRRLPTGLTQPRARRCRARRCLRRWCGRVDTARARCVDV
jgi:hypothetical protein